MIGQSPPRKEDERLVTGRGRFIDDIAPAGALHVARQLAGELVDPPVHPDLVALVDHPALLVGMQQRDDAGHEERGLDVVAPQQIEDARHSYPRAVLAL